MNIGYSLLLSEFIKAEEIEYDDCKNFQIVCPSCKEPIFKVVRESKESPLHYLSHYEKNKYYIEECELRISSLSQAEIQRKNSKSQNQRLQYFLNILQDVIYTTEYSDPEIGKRIIRKVNKSKALDKYRHIRYEHAKRAFSKKQENDILEFFENYVEEMKEINGDFYKTSFSIEKQKRIALDIWYHLLSANAKENYFFLFNHSYAFLMSRVEKASKVRKLFDWEIYLNNTMVKILNTSKLKGFELLDSLHYYKIQREFEWSVDNLLDKMSAEVTHEMFGCLLRLPYFELLKKQF